MDLIDESSASENMIVKRRSSMFHTKALPFETKDHPPGHNKGSGESSTHENEFDLKTYIQQLKDERKSWQEILKQRKTQRRELAKQKLKIETQGQPMNTANFSESVKSFLSDRPNYNRIFINHKKLCNEAIKMAVANQHLNKLKERFVSRMEEKLQNISKEIIARAQSEMEFSIEIIRTTWNSQGMNLQRMSGHHIDEKKRDRLKYKRLF